MLFSFISLSYIALIGTTIYSYANVDEDLPGDLPKVVLLFPAIITLMVPLTYGMLLFAVPENHRTKSTALLGTFMGLGLIGLSIAVYLFAS